jgi:hypothetical protein
MNLQDQNNELLELFEHQRNKLKILIEQWEVKIEEIENFKK